MSLQIWLPLTESLQNYGVLNTPTPTTDVAFATNGKIGGKWKNWWQMPQI